MKSGDKNIQSDKTNNKFTIGGKLTEKEFTEGIKSAEKGPFYTVQESMNQFEKWVKRREKK